MFTKRKFLSFSMEKQHKKCAELLLAIYKDKIAFQSTEEMLAHYHELQEWMQREDKISSDAKEIANRYHYHLKLANRKVREHHLLPSIRQGDRAQGEKIWPISIYLDSLRSAHNVGSIIRTTEAFALGAIYFSEHTPYINHPQVQKASMGTFQWIECHPSCKVTDLPRPLIVMETSPQATSLYNFIFPEVFTLALGNEEYGCSDEVLRVADHLIEIPLRGRKNSLNVANAFAITASEIYRQKKEDHGQKST
jgi:tRNA G18 (ribose-2'-O)-methylase SpoU